MERYTSLTRLKMALADGRMPPMTPLSPRAMALLNPDFCIGMGAFMETEEMGLRCPVCGKWFHDLTKHLNARHAELGGSAASNGC